MSDLGQMDDSTSGVPAASEPKPLEPLQVDGEEHSVDVQTIKVARMVGTPIVCLLSLAPLVLFTIGWAVGGIPGRIYGVILTIIFVLASLALTIVFRWPAARYRHLRYLVEEDGLRIRRGVFWRKVVWIPITRVQHTDVSQGPLQRKYGIGTLTVHTAGTAGASIALPGLEHGIATRLSTHLRPAPPTKSPAAPPGASVVDLPEPGSDAD